MSEGAPEVVRPPAPAPFEFLRAKARAASSSVTVTNTGVLSIIPGAGVTVDHPTGDVTVSATGGGGPLNIWSLSTFITAPVALTAGGLAVITTLTLNTAGQYLIGAVALVNGAGSGGAVFLQWADDPIAAANALVSQPQPTSGTNPGASLLVSAFSNTNNRVIALVGAADTGSNGFALQQTTGDTIIPRATGITAVQLTQVS